MSQVSSSPNFSAYRTVGEAAEFLGVSTATLRNWDRLGKLKPRRHPQNGYRIYLHEDLEAVLRSADLSNLTDASIAPAIDWDALEETEHFVQFYETDAFLVDSVSGFLGAALTAGNAGIIIATEEHRAAIRGKLAACGVDVPLSVAEGRCVMLDAAETMAKFMVDGMPDARRFAETIGELFERAAAGSRQIRAFGEMVALLWANGLRDAAILLEQLWCELGKQRPFALFCGYPLSGFSSTADADLFQGVCACHSRVFPAESYAALTDSYERQRAVTLLQQKAQSLAAEIAHRSEVEHALADRERELADFFENATEGLHKVGPDGTILWANKAEYGLLGYAAEEYIGHSITEFHADGDVIADMLERLQRGEVLENVPARLRCQDGSFKHVLVSSSARFNDGQFAYTRCFTRDVTERWQAEQARREADRRKDEFLAILAHELRNPLAPMNNALELLRMGGGNAEVAEDARSILERQMRQMTRLVEDLLDISRITRNNIELRNERVDLASVVNSAIETSRPAIDGAGHKLTVTLPLRPIFVHADATRLAQVFANLLTNSAKYTATGGQIWIEAERQGQEAVVAVRDNGVGIAGEDLDSVFDMFRQVDRSLERSQGGLGVGLTLVRRLVELHGGSVQARSEGPGKGSAFVVRLPLAAPESIRAGTGRVSCQPAAVRRRVLVVDDNHDSGDTLSMFLRIKGHDVRTARNGLEAIEAVPEFLPEIVLMDVGMPKMNGYDATRQIRQLPCGRNIVIVAVTGWGQEDDKQRATEAGCTAHLTKPVDFAALERLLATGAGPAA
jgi:PAS domain S-box-containing protein